MCLLFVHFITYFKTQNCLPFASVKTFGLPAAPSKPPAFVATCFVAMARPYEQTNEKKLKASKIKVNRNEKVLLEES